jgi:hypothetical protein
MGEKKFREVRILLMKKESAIAKQIGANVQSHASLYRSIEK